MSDLEVDQINEMVKTSFVLALEQAISVLKEVRSGVMSPQDGIDTLKRFIDEAK